MKKKDLGMITKNPMTGEKIKPVPRKIIKLFRYSEHSEPIDSNISLESSPLYRDSVGGEEMGE